MPDTTKIKVLIAEDEPLVRRSYARLLGDEYDTIFAANGGEALRTIESGWKHDLILSDYDMGTGYMNGVDFCRRLRALGIKTPFVLISGNDRVRELAEECGANWGLAKPAMRFQIDKLVQFLVPRPTTPRTAEDLVEEGDRRREWERDAQALGELEKK